MTSVRTLVKLKWQLSQTIGASVASHRRDGVVDVNSSRQLTLASQCPLTEDGLRTKAAGRKPLASLVPAIDDRYERRASHTCI